RSPPFRQPLAELAPTATSAAGPLSRRLRPIRVFSWLRCAQPSRRVRPPEEVHPVGRSSSSAFRAAPAPARPALLRPVDPLRTGAGEARRVARLAHEPVLRRLRPGGDEAPVLEAGGGSRIPLDRHAHHARRAATSAWCWPRARPWRVRRTRPSTQ